MPTALSTATPARPRTTHDLRDAAPGRLPAPFDRADAARCVDVGLEGHRAELRAHCRQMLGSSSEVDDAVQETLIRAWRSIDRFEGRSTVRAWLYRIATNVCLDMLSAPQRRARPLADAADGAAPAASPGPGETAVQRDEVAQAFVVALGRLPPLQRTVLVLREVFGWRAAEVAELLGVSAASVNSALQRARATLGAGRHSSRRPSSAAGDRPHGVLTPCVDAFERYEIERLASLLRDEPAREGDGGRADRRAASC